MNISIKKADFNKAMSKVRNFVAKDADRADLNFIRIEVIDKEAVFTALDGHRGIRHKCPCEIYGDGVFIGYIRPISLPAKGSQKVNLEHSDNITVVRYRGTYRENYIWEFDDAKDFFDLESELLEPCRARDMSALFNTKLLKQSLSSFDKDVHIYVGTTPAKPWYFKSGNTEAVVLTSILKED